MAFDVTLKEYLKQIDESPLLDREQECELAKKIIDENDPEARDRMVKSNLRLVVNIAKRFTGRNLTLADLIEEGNLGLLRAVDSFDPDYGVRFSTYAAWWIKQGIKRALLLNAQPMHIPTYMVELLNQYRHVAGEMQSRLGREPQLSEIAEEMQITMRKVKAINEIFNAINTSLNADSEQEDTLLEETLCDHNAIPPDHNMLSDEELSKALDLLETLEPREAQILTMRFGLDGAEPVNFKEIAEEIGLTRERIRQIQKEALEKLKECLTYD